MQTPTDWTSAIAIVAGGLVLGLLFVYFFSRRKSAATIGGEGDLVRKDLEAKRDALIQQLRDLETETLTPDQLAETRSRLERETADVLRALDEHRSVTPVAPAAPVVAAGQTSGMNPATKGFLWGFGSFAMLALMGYLVMQTAKPREEGGSLTGDIPTTSGQSQQQQAPSDPVVQQLEAAVAQNPDNLELRNNLAQAYLERDNLMGVFEQTRFILGKNPNDSRALSYQALVRLAMGEAQAAAQMLQKATETDPKNMDAWVGLAWVQLQSDKVAEAEKAIASAALNAPENKARLDDVFQQMKTQVAMAKAQPQQQVAGSQLPADHPPIDGTAPDATPDATQAINDRVAAMAQAMGGNAPRPAPDGRNIRVTLSLDPSARSTTGVIYVIARNPAGGPPVAVKRLAAANLPITFDFGSADSMMGQPLPDKFRLEARLDSDGDAASKSPNDPTASQENVAPGSSVTLALK
ncbi:MAG TPA: tetratricopeptide repeat protein [Thermoanaerobaculia bacterium]|jgi:cytochrome c-type biogenesis protein CcmH